MQLATMLLWVRTTLLRYDRASRAIIIFSVMLSSIITTLPSPLSQAVRMGEVLYGSYDWAVFEGLEKRYIHTLHLNKSFLMLLVFYRVWWLVVGLPKNYQNLECVFGIFLSSEDKYYFCVQKIFIKC